MKKLPFKDLYGQNFTIQFIHVLKTLPSVTDVYVQSQESICTTLLFLHKCSARYAVSDGTVFIAKHKDVVLIPPGCCYEMQYSNISQESYTVAIQLHLLDITGEELSLADQPFIVSTGGTDCANYFDQINDNRIAYPSALSMVYADLYQLFHLFTTEYEKNVYAVGQFSSIAKAIDHLRCDDAYRMSVSEMAQECNVSESYLRRQFKLYSGMSPARYIRTRKIMSAKNLLRYSDLSLKEIAARLAAEDISYFCRIFRQETGMTPSQYRKLHHKR